MYLVRLSFSRSAAGSRTCEYYSNNPVLETGRCNWNKLIITSITGCVFACACACARNPAVLLH